MSEAALCDYRIKKVLFVFHRQQCFIACVFIYLYYTECSTVGRLYVIEPLS